MKERLTIRADELKSGDHIASHGFEERPWPIYGIHHITSDSGRRRVTCAVAYGHGMGETLRFSAGTKVTVLR